MQRTRLRLAEAGARNRGRLEDSLVQEVDI